MVSISDGLAILRAAIPHGKECAYFDFPLYFNFGDLLIWHGAQKLLGEMNLRVIFSQSSAYANSGKFFFPELKEDTLIIIQGGGNFGDLYPEHQNYREEIVKRYPRNSIFMLPCSVHFNNDAEASRSVAVLQKHNNLTTMVRDKFSFSYLNELGLKRVLLVPDTAHALNAEWFGKDLSLVKDVGPLKFFRRDGESVFSSRQSDAIDWNAYITLTDRIIKKSIEIFELRFARSNSLSLFATKIWQRRSRLMLQRAAANYRKFQAVETDRLHTHILCCILGIPVSLHDNEQKKNSHYYDCWTKESRLVKLMGVGD